MQSIEIIDVRHRMHGAGISEGFLFGQSVQIFKQIDIAPQGVSPMFHTLQQ